jgi:hypothetical protein
MSISTILPPRMVRPSTDTARPPGAAVGKPLLPAVRRQTQKVAPTSYRRLKDRLERGGEQRTAP